MPPNHVVSISVIIPVYQVTEYLEEALRSVVTQRYPHEVIVVDDGSKADAAAEIGRICSLFPDIILLRRPHSSAAAARHAGVMHTQCEAIVFLDGDDVLLPGALRFFAEGLIRHPDAVAVYGQRRDIDKKGKIIGPVLPSPKHMGSGRDILIQILKHGCPFCNGSACVRRQALLKLKPGNEQLVLGEDWVLWSHLALSGNIVPAGQQIVMHYRAHAQNISYQLMKNYSLLFDAYKAVFTDPQFIAALGAEEIERLHERCVSETHAHLASWYAAKSEPEKARHHFERITISLASIKG